MSCGFWSWWIWISGLWIVISSSWQMWRQTSWDPLDATLITWRGLNHPFQILGTAMILFLANVKMWRSALFTTSEGALIHTNFAVLPCKTQDFSHTFELVNSHLSNIHVLIFLDEASKQLAINKSAKAKLEGRSLFLGPNIFHQYWCGCSENKIQQL